MKRAVESSKDDYEMMRQHEKADHEESRSADERNTKEWNGREGNSSNK